MKYNKLLSLLGNEGFFDLASVIQLTDENRQNIRTQLYRWCKSGRLIPLRRGMYAFAKPYRQNMVNPAELANWLYAPSYLSTYWALGFYGLIPEMVVVYTSVASRVSKIFKNDFGMFSYSQIKSTGFFGYGRVEIGKCKVVLAGPEKALLDLWYLEKGKWSMERMQEMRFQNFEAIDNNKLREYALRFNSNKLLAALGVWTEVARLETEGMKDL